MRENLNAIKRLVAFFLTVFLFATTVWNDVFVIATEENHCSEYVDEQTYAANVLQPVGEGDGYCDHCGQVVQSHVHEEPAVEPTQEEVALDDAAPETEAEGEAQNPDATNPEVANPDPAAEEPEGGATGDTAAETEIDNPQNSDETPTDETDIDTTPEDEQLDEEELTEEELVEEEELEEEEECEHEWSYTSNNNGTHIKKCKLCDEELEEDCLLDDNGVCHLCGYEDERLVYQSTTKKIFGTVVTVSGKMPRGSYVEIYYAGTKPVEDIINENSEDNNVTALVAFDINIYRRGGEKYQPQEDGGSVNVRFAGVDEVEELAPEEVSVYRIEDNDTVTKIDCQVDGENVSFKADHFTIYAAAATNLTNPSTRILESYEHFAMIGSTGSNEYTTLTKAYFYVYFPTAGTINFTIDTYKNLTSATNPISVTQLYASETVTVTGASGEYKEVGVNFTPTASSYITANKYYSVVVSADNMCNVVVGQEQIKSYIYTTSDEWVVNDDYEGIFHIESNDTAPTDSSLTIASIKDQDGNELLKANESYIYYYGKNDTDTFTATFNEANVDRTITWGYGTTTSSSIVQIVSTTSTTASIKAVGAGSAKITATYGSSTKTININVLEFKVGTDSFEDYSVQYTGAVIHPDVKGYITGAAESNLAVTYDDDNELYSNVNDDAKVYLTYTSPVDSSYKKNWTKSFKITPLEITEDVFFIDTDPHDGKNDRDIEFEVASGEIQSMTGMGKISGTQVTPVYNQNRQDFSAIITNTELSAGGMEYTIAISGIGNFTGDFDVKLTNGKGLTKIDTILKAQARGTGLSGKTYTGNDFALTDRYDSTTLLGWNEVEFVGNDEVAVDEIVTKETADVTITDLTTGASDAASAGLKKITFTMKQNSGYEGSLSVNFRINPANISAATIEWTDTKRNFKHKVGDAEVQPQPDIDFVVKFGGNVVHEFADDAKTIRNFTVSYSNNTAITSNARVILTGSGNFTGEKTDIFNIVANFANDVVVIINDGTEYRATAANDFNFTTAGYTRLYDPTFGANMADVYRLFSVQIPGNREAVSTLEQGRDYTIQVYDEGSTTLTADVATKKIVKITPSADIKTDFGITDSGEVIASFDISPRSIANSAIYKKFTKPTGKKYTGKPIVITRASSHDEPANLELYYTVKGYTLGPDDYDVTYNDTNINAGTAKLTLTGKGNFTGTVSGTTYTFTIGKASLQDSNVTVEWPSDMPYTYDGTAKEPVMTVKIDGNTIGEFADEAKTIRNYTVSYSNNVNATTSTNPATVTITAGTNGNDGKNLEKSIVKTFTISPRNAQITGIKIGGENGVPATLVNSAADPQIWTCRDLNVFYTGNVYKGNPAVYTADGKIDSSNYYVSYSPDPSVRNLDTSNPTASPYIKIAGRGNYAGTNAIVLYNISPVIIAENDPDLNVEYTQKYDYTGGDIEVAISSITYKGNSLTSPDDYTIEYPTDNPTYRSSAGEKTAKIKFTGSYAYKDSANTDGYPLNYTVGINLDDANTQISFTNPFYAEAGTEEGFYETTGTGYRVRWINGYSPIVHLVWKKADNTTIVEEWFNGSSSTNKTKSDSELEFTDPASMTNLPNKYDSRPAASKENTYNTITVTVTPRPNTQFYGTRTIKYEIQPMDIGNSTLITRTGTVRDYPYTGALITPIVKLQYKYGTNSADTYNLNTKTEAGQEVAINSDFELNTATIGPAGVKTSIYRKALGYGNFKGEAEFVFGITQGDVTLWLQPKAGGRPIELKPLLKPDPTSDDQTFEITDQESYFYQKGQEYKPDLYLMDASGTDKLTADECTTPPVYTNYDVPSKNGVKATAEFTVFDNENGNYKPRKITVSYTISTNDIGEANGGYTAVMKNFIYDAQTTLDPGTIKQKIEADSEYLVVKRGNQVLTYAANEDDANGDYVILTSDEADFVTWKSENNITSNYTGTNNSPSVDDTVNYIWIKGINAYSGYKKVPVKIYLNIANNTLVKVSTNATRYNLDDNGENPVAESTGDPLAVIIKYKAKDDPNISTILDEVASTSTTPGAKSYTNPRNYTITRGRDGYPGPDRTIKVTAKADSCCIGTKTAVKEEGSDSDTFPRFLVSLATYSKISLASGKIYPYTGNPVSVTFKGINNLITVEGDKAIYEDAIDSVNGDYTIVYIGENQVGGSLLSNNPATTGGKWYAILKSKPNSRFFKYTAGAEDGNHSDTDAVRENYAFAIKYYIDDDYVNFTFDGGDTAGYDGNTITVPAMITTKDGKVPLYNYRRTDTTQRDFYVSINPTSVSSMGTYDIVVTPNPDNPYVVDPTPNTLYSKKFTVKGVPIKAEYVSFVDDVSNLIFTGTAYSPEVKVQVTGSSTPLRKDVDYTVSYENEVDAGTAKVIVTGKGNYSGTQELTFNINKKQLDDKDILQVDGSGNLIVDGDGNTQYKTGFENYSKITVEVDEASYLGMFDDKNNSLNVKIEPSFTVKYGNVTLVKDVDYELVKYENQDSISTEVLHRNHPDTNPKIIIKAKDNARNYIGGKEQIYVIDKLDISNTGVVSISPDSTEYTGEAIELDKIIHITVPYGDKTVTLNKGGVEDYKITVMDPSNGDTVNEMKDMKTYKLIITGLNNCKGEVQREFTVNKRSLAENYHYFYKTGEGFKGTWEYKTNLYENETGHEVVPGFVTRGINPETGNADALLIWIEDVTSVAKGGENKPKVHIWDYGVKDANGDPTELRTDDYKVSVTNASEAGTADWAREIPAKDPYHAPVASTSPAITITGQGERYKDDSITLPFNIGKNIKNLNLEITYKVNGENKPYNPIWDNPTATTLETGIGSWERYEYNGYPQTPTVTVRLINANGTKTTLRENVAYEVSYTDINGNPDDSINAGWKNVVITGIGDYCGTKSQTYGINKKKITAVTQDNKAFTNENPMETTQGELTFNLSGTGLYRFTDEATAIKYLVPEGVTEEDAKKFVGYYYAIYDGEPVKPDVTVRDNTLGPERNRKGVISSTDLDVDKNSTDSYPKADTVSTFEYSGSTLNYTTSQVVIGFANKKDDGAGDFSAGGNYYVGETSVKYSINYFILRHDISDDFTVSFVNGFDNNNVPYNEGKAISAPVEVKKGLQVLEEGVDYELVYYNNSAPSYRNPATVTVKGIDKYRGEQTLSFTITCDLDKTSIYYYNEDNVFTKCQDPYGPTQLYSGTWIYKGEPEIYLVLEANNNHEDIILEYGTDYSAPSPSDHYSEDSYVRSGEVYYRAIPNSCWTGSKTVLYDIEYDESSVRVTNNEGTYKYTGRDIKPKFNVNISTAKIDRDNILYERVALDSNGNVTENNETTDFKSLGYIRATIPYKVGEYPGEVTVIYQITPRPISECTVIYASEQRYTGRAVKPAFTVVIESTDLQTEKPNEPYTVPETDYKVNYGNYICNDYAESQTINYNGENLTLSRAGKGMFVLTGNSDEITRSSTKGYEYGIKLQSPANLEVKDNIGESMRAEWVSDVYSNGTDLKLQTANNGTYKTNITTRIAGSRGAYLFENLKSSTNYRVMATAYAKLTDGTTIYSDDKYIDVVTEVAANDIKVESTKVGKAKVSWVPSGDIVLYYVYRADDPVSEGKVVAIIPASSGSYTNSKLTSGTTYYYHIDGYALIDGVLSKDPVNSSDHVAVTIK